MQLRLGGPIRGRLAVVSNVAMRSRRVFQSANHVEAALWGLIGLSFLVHAAATRRSVRVSAIAAVTFLLFGASDIVEATTGAWWRPWWLFCWKAACVLSMLALFVKHRRGDFRDAGGPSEWMLKSR